MSPLLNYSIFDNEVLLLKNYNLKEHINIRKDNFAIKREIYLRSDTNLHLDQSVGAYGHHAILILNRRQVRSEGPPSSTIPHTNTNTNTTNSIERQYFIMKSMLDIVYFLVYILICYFVPEDIQDLAVCWWKYV